MPDDRLILPNCTCKAKHLRVHERRWISIEGQQEQYADTRVDAVRKDRQWQLTTKNVSRLKLDPPAGAKLTIEWSSGCR